MSIFGDILLLLAVIDGTLLALAVIFIIASAGDRPIDRPDRVLREAAIKLLTVHVRAVVYPVLCVLWVRLRVRWRLLLRRHRRLDRRYCELRQAIGNQPRP